MTSPTDCTEAHALISGVWAALSAAGLAQYFDVHLMADRPASFRKHMTGKVALVHRGVPFADAGADTVEEALAAARLIRGRW